MRDADDLVAKAEHESQLRGARKKRGDSHDEILADRIGAFLGVRHYRYIRNCPDRRYRAAF